MILPEHGPVRHGVKQGPETRFAASFKKETNFHKQINIVRLVSQTNKEFVFIYKFLGSLDDLEKKIVNGKG